MILIISKINDLINLLKWLTINKLIDYANLCKVMIIGEPLTGKRVRPRKYLGKVIINDIDKDYSRFIHIQQ